MTLRTDVAALYVDPRGPYPALVADCWDEARDAKKYAGPLPVICHPPCGPWGRMRGLCRYQDPSCGPAAVEAVRTFGGVLEHPADSRLFAATGMPRPGEHSDKWGGFTIYVEQVSWGHVCRKPTWLYMVGISWWGLRQRTGGVPTHRITSGPRGPSLPSASRRAARLSPPAFARWLVEAASSVYLGQRCELCSSPREPGSSTCAARECVEFWASAWARGAA